MLMQHFAYILVPKSSYPFTFKIKAIKQLLLSV